jgi:hypothetical protein
MNLIGRKTNGLILICERDCKTVKSFTDRVQFNEGAYKNAITFQTYFNLYNN